jgi:transcriptional regulator with XRE-family HTH domain
LFTTPIFLPIRCACAIMSRGLCSARKAVVLVDELRRLRTERGWSQQDLADRSGVDRATISLAEGGRRGPRIETMEKLAKAMGVEVADFFPKSQPALFPEPSESPAGFVQAPAAALVPQDVADLIDCPPATVRRWIRSGLLKAVEAGGDYEIRHEDFVAFLRAFGVELKDLPGPRPAKSPDELFAEADKMPRRREDAAFVVVGRIVTDARGNEDYRMVVLWNVPPEERGRYREQARMLAGTDDYLEREMDAATRKALAASVG